jgi:hypothetical protein
LGAAKRRCQSQPSGDGHASATDIPTGATVTLDLTDPDSMTKDPRGNIVVDSQADSELIFVRNPLTDGVTSSWDAFDDGLGNGGGDDAAQLPAGCREQVAELLFGALAPAWENEHLEV